MNKVILIGRLGGDPEKRFTPSGSVIVSATLATTRRWKDKNGEKQEATDWHRLQVWGRTGEVLAEYAHKGAQICVTGRLTTDSYEKDGVKHYVASVVVDELELLGSKPAGGSAAAVPPGASPAVDNFNDDIPF